jgi:hypothetical protein
MDPIRNPLLKITVIVFSPFCMEDSWNPLENAPSIFFRVQFPLVWISFHPENTSHRVRWFSLATFHR